jgi:hypothetical protein
MGAKATMSGSTLDFVTILTNIDDVTGPGKAIWVAVDAFCYVMALIFTMSALFQLRAVVIDNGRTSMKAPIMSLIAAVIFAAAPTSISSLAVSFYGDLAVSPLSSVSVSDSNRPARALLQFVTVIGYFFFCRGVFVVKQCGQPERYPQASGGKAFCILLAAMFAIYIDTTLRFLGSFSGWNVDKYLN